MDARSNELPPTPPPSEGEPTPKLRVLLVDDMPAMTKLLSMVLRQTNPDDISSIEEAKNADEALEKYEAVDPDLVLSDWHMPGMDGMQLAREITRRRRKKEDTRPFNMVLVTAGMGGESTPKPEEMREAGFNFVVRKPFEASTIKQVIDTIRQRRQAAQQPPPQS